MSAASPALRPLDLSGNAFGSAARAARAAHARTPALCRLSTLDLSRNAMDAAALSALLRIDTLQTLESLTLDGNALSTGGDVLVAALDPLSSLSRLSLRDTRLDSAMVRALAASGLAGRLQALDVGLNQLNDTAAAALSRPPGFHALGYGVYPSHYHAVVTTMLDTLRDLMRDE